MPPPALEPPGAAATAAHPHNSQPLLHMLQSHLHLPLLHLLSRHTPAAAVPLLWFVARGWLREAGPAAAGGWLVVTAGRWV